MGPVTAREAKSITIRKWGLLATLVGFVLLFLIPVIGILAVVIGAIAVIVGSLLGYPDWKNRPHAKPLPKGTYHVPPPTLPTEKAAPASEPTFNEDLNFTFDVDLAATLSGGRRIEPVYVQVDFDPSCEWSGLYTYRWFLPEEPQVGDRVIVDARGELTTATVARVGVRGDYKGYIKVIRGKR